MRTSVYRTTLLSLVGAAILRKPFATAVIVSATCILAGVRLEAQGPAETKPASQWDAKCIAVEVPDEVLTDQVFVGRITVKNTGSAPWSSIPHSGQPKGNCACGRNRR